MVTKGNLQDHAQEKVFLLNEGHYGHRRFYIIILQLVLYRP